MKKIISSPSENVKVFHIYIILPNEGYVNIYLFGENVFSKCVLCNLKPGYCSRYSHWAMDRTTEEFYFDSQEGREIILSFLFLNLQAGSDAHPTPYSVVTGGSFPAK